LDALRRDFTINALSCDIKGNIYDYIGGIEDLLKARLRFIGKPVDRIIEDTLRILRFFRFSALVPYMQPDETSFHACSSNAHLLINLSGERITQEMCKILAMGDGHLAIRQMQIAGLADYLPIPIMDLSLYIKICGISKLLNQKMSPILYLAALTKGVRYTKDKLRTMATRLKLSNKDTEHLLMLNDTYPIYMDIAKDIKLLRAKGTGTFLEIFVLYWAGNGTPSERVMTNYYTQIKQVIIPLFPVGGDDLIKLGLQSGPIFSSLLKEAEAKWEESGCRITKEELLSFVLECSDSTCHKRT
jgi:poly(A) polymerase